MDPEDRPKRGAARFMAVLPAVLHEGEREHPCGADNLSRSGVLLLGRLPRPETPDVTVSITTPTGDRTLRVRGRVVHYRAEGEEGENRIGLEFDRLTAEQVATLEALVSRVVEGMAPAALETIPKRASLQQVRQALAKIPVAHRVMLASRAGPSERSILLKDTHPEVLESLARNPLVVAHEIKSLLRRPDLAPTTLAVIADDRRWIADEEIKIMTATHPRVTFVTADQVVSRLNDLQIQRLLRRPGLQPGVRQKLMSKLSGKYRGSG